MGFWGLATANVWAVSNHARMEEAREWDDIDVSDQIESEGIDRILKAGLTSSQRSTFWQLRETNPAEIERRLHAAFERGWLRGLSYSLSNAMDEALREAQAVLKEHN